MTTAKHLKRTSIALGGLIASATLALAQGFPTKQISVSMPFAAGGPGDAITRIVAQGMGEPLKQQMIVELHLLHGMPFREVARTVGTSEESARRNYGHAVKKLRAILLPDDEPAL